MTTGSKNASLRAARNQVLYREVNEKIAELNAAFEQALSVSSTWICECAEQGCVGTMELTLVEYEHLRAHPNRFAVLPEHVDGAIERVVEERPTYVVVEMLGPAATFAVEHDPRAGHSGADRDGNHRPGCSAK